MNATQVDAKDRIAELGQRVLGGEQIDREEALFLFGLEDSADIHTLLSWGNRIREHFREHFRNIRKIFQCFGNIFEVFGRVRTHADAFGPAGTHSDALGCIWKRLDLFDKIWNFLGFLNRLLAFWT